VDDDLLTIADAAHQLNTTPDAIRQRLKRGGLQGEKRAGRWYVQLDMTGQPSAATSRMTERDQSATGQPNTTTEHDQSRSDAATELAELRQRVRELIDERDWLRGQLAGALMLANRLALPAPKPEAEVESQRKQPKPEKPRNLLHWRMPWER
jgi:hypothetical protein